MATKKKEQFSKEEAVLSLRGWGGGGERGEEGGGGGEGGGEREREREREVENFNTQAVKDSSIRSDWTSRQSLLFY